MPELRWILLLVGLAVIVGVYWWGRRDQSRRLSEKSARAERFEPHLTGQAPSPRERQEPALEDTLDDELFDELAEAEFEHEEPFEESASTDPTPPDSTQPGQPAAEREKLLVLRVATPNGERIGASEVVEALLSEELQHGRYQIFHAWDPASRIMPVFSAASMVEPGSFDLDHLDGVTLPGLTLFATLPGPIDGVTAFDRMLDTARRIAARLDCVVLDESGNSLTNQRIGYIRDDINDFQLHRARPGGSTGSKP